MSEKNCKGCGAELFTEETDNDFFERISPVFDGKKYLLPNSALCNPCRQQRRMSYRNERSIYKRKCDLCAKEMISVYSPDKKYTVYCKDCWWSDKWDALDFGKDFDFTRSFFEQYKEIYEKVPRLGIINAMEENSDYGNYQYSNKDCYLMFTSDFDEKCYYGCFVWQSLNCLDNLFVTESTLCYECVDCSKCYECFYCQKCEQCRNCIDCFDCKNCSNCYGCSGLRNKEYCFENEQLSKEEYEKREKKMERKNRGDVPRRPLFLINCENCHGDNLKNSKNTFMCFDGHGVEDSKYFSNAGAAVQNCYDFDGGGGAYWSYECISTGMRATNCIASDHNWNNGTNILICSYVMSVSDLFGCVGLRNKKYCILNKQYSKEEYEKLAAKILAHMKAANGIGHGLAEWGEFFPPALSPYGYNETVANQYYPLSKSEAIAKGFNWSNYGQTFPEGDAAIICEVSGRPFKPVKQELDFYKKYGLPIPKRHPEIRHAERMKMRNPRKIWTRNCAKCGAMIQTSYSTDRPEIVYCEACYLATVY